MFFAPRRLLALGKKSAPSYAWMEIAVVPRTRRAALAQPPEQTTTFRLEFELFGRKCPMAVENFSTLCNGSSVVPATTAKDGIHESTFKDQFLPQLTYKNSAFHRFMPGLCAQGGDIVSGDGTGQISIFGDTFDAAEETAGSAFDTRGLLGTAVSAPHMNGSQFFIVTHPNGLPHLNGTCICFGRVTRGLEQLLGLESSLSFDYSGNPTDCSVTITDCGAK